MNNFITKIAFIATILFAFLSCNKPDNNADNVNKNIYICGAEVKGDTYYAKYWINGEGHLLCDTNTNSYATSITSYKGDIYIAGSIGDSAVYWKNNIVYWLPGGIRAYDIKVINGDVYAAGIGNVNPVYWKNGVANVISENFGGATAIDVVGNDVHVIGHEVIGNQVVARYWKNGENVSLPDCGSIHDVLVYNNDVYITGNETLPNKIYAVVWKNGVKQVLSDNSLSTKVAVFGKDVYVAGCSGIATGVKYWKNGKSVKLSEFGVASDIAVFFDDVYVIGCIDYYYYESVLWKNDQIIFTTKDKESSVFTGMCISLN